MRDMPGSPQPVYYNEFDPSAAAKLAGLMADGLIPAGVIDTRSIAEVQADDLEGFVQCHFFAGIGGWPLALSIAGWPAHRPVWTGSCPCPPFSSAGRQFRCSVCDAVRPVPCPRRTGVFICWHCGNSWFADERHLFPEFWRLIAKRRPATVLGEQVASGDGRTWLAGVRGALEILGYAVGSTDLCAAGAGEEARGRFLRGDQEWWQPITLGPPHIRQRLFIVAHDQGGGHEQRSSRRRQGGEPQGETGRSRPSIHLEHGQRTGLEGHAGHGADGHEPGRQHPEQDRPVAATGGAVCLGDGDGDGCQSRIAASASTGYGSATEPDGGGGHWSRLDAVWCRDGTWRRIEPGSFPLAHGLPRSMGQLSPRQQRLAEVAGLDGASLKRAKAFRSAELRGYGNAIEITATVRFIRASMDAMAIQWGGINEHPPR